MNYTMILNVQLEESLTYRSFRNNALVIWKLIEKKCSEFDNCFLFVTPTPLRQCIHYSCVTDEERLIYPSGARRDILRICVATPTQTLFDNVIAASVHIRVSEWGLMQMVIQITPVLGKWLLKCRLAEVINQTKHTKDTRCLCKHCHIQNSNIDNASSTELSDMYTLTFAEVRGELMYL